MQVERVVLPDLGMLTGKLPQHVTFCSTRLLECSQFLCCLALMGDMASSTQVGSFPVTSTMGSFLAEYLQLVQSLQLLQVQASAALIATLKSGSFLS